jgi:S-layer protein (TIGR01564 family)
MKQEYNLVLIGGPVANTIVQELVDLGKTTFEKWDTSEGELELIADAFADGKHVLIVAGKDRDATTMAALDLVNAL